MAKHAPVGRAAIPCLILAMSLAVLFGLDAAAAPPAGCIQVQGVSMRPRLKLNGQPVPPEPVQWRRTGNNISAELTAPQDGIYRFGVDIEAAEITPLVPGSPRYTAESLDASITLYYPYDWTWTGSGHVLSRAERLVTPGLEAAGAVFLLDTHELTALSLRRTGDAVLATFLKHRVRNDGHDVATPDLRLRAGQRVQLEILCYPSLGAANRDRFGVAAPMSGRITQIPYRGWTAIDLTSEQYERAARSLSGVFDYVILREPEICSGLPEIFHRHGIRVLAYQYLGALRRASIQVSDDLEREIGLKGADGTLYTAPRSPNGNWLLCDLRQPKVRQHFVDHAKEAVTAGFDGVFLDGYPFWPDATGRCGGSVPRAKQSLAYARWLLLHETGQAIHGVNRDARLGVLANHYYDSLGEADFVMKESMYFVWDGFPKRFDQRGVRINQRETLQAIADYRGPIIQTIEPANRWIHVAGKSTIWCDEACAVEFSAPVLIRTDTEAPPRGHVRRLEMAPKARYHVVTVSKRPNHPR